MARSNRPRSIGGERNLAERIRRERALRGWSPADLAQKMTSAGCSIATSAIYKIEDEEKPRKISVDELIALATVFGESVENMLTPMAVLEQERAQQLLRDFDAAAVASTESTAKVIQCFIDLFEMRIENEEIFDYVMGHQFRQDEPAREDEPLFTIQFDDGTEESFDDSIMREGVLAYEAALAKQAEQIVMDRVAKAKARAAETNGER